MKLNELKAAVRSTMTDEQVRTFGKLTVKSTWEAAYASLNTPSPEPTPEREDSVPPTELSQTSVLDALGVLAKEYDNYVPVCRLAEMLGFPGKTDLWDVLYALEAEGKLECRSLVHSSEFAPSELVWGYETRSGSAKFFLKLPIPQEPTQTQVQEEPKAYDEVSELKVEIERLKTENQRWQEELVKSDKRVTNFQETDDLKQRVFALEHDLEMAKETIDTQAAALDRLRNQPANDSRWEVECKSYRYKLAEAEERITELEIQNEMMTQQLNASEYSRKKYQQEDRQQTAEIKELNTKLDESRQYACQLERHVGKMGQELSRLERELGGVDARPKGVGQATPAMPVALMVVAVNVALDSFRHTLKDMTQSKTARQFIREVKRMRRAA